MRTSLALWLLLATTLAAQETAPAVRLAIKGEPQMPVVVAKDAPGRVREAAKTLADYLTKITGGKLTLIEGDGATGIAVGRVEDFPALKIKLPKSPFAQDDYLLRSHGRGVLLIGATDDGVDHAVWDFLYRLGHRQFFPGPAWEVTPRDADLAVRVDAIERPSFHSRRIWYGFGTWDYNAKPYQDWCLKNRTSGGIPLSTGHAYDGIVARNKSVFAAHPEYLGLYKGERKTHQFCISNPELRKLVIEDSLAQMKREPRPQTLSLEPADGGGWCECEQCRKMGSVSDRALTLANGVAEALQKDYPGTLVGMYAYSEHSPPPSIKVHPNVVVSAATGFIRGGYTVDQLMDGWHKQGATLGVREYFSVHTWDRDLPGAARATRLSYIKETIPRFHAKGARFFSAESSDNWGPNGLGYYLAARLLWNVREAKNIDRLVDDFLDKAFGPAREPMAKFYRLLDGDNRPLLSDDLVGRMYRLLEEARRLSDDPAIRRRLDDLALYTRYVELWLDYAHAEGAARQSAFEDLIKHGYRMRGTMLIHVKALYRDLAARDKTVAIPKEAAWGVPEPKNPWKSSKPFDAGEVAAIIDKGIERRQLFAFTPVSFGKELVPVELKLPDVAPGNFGLYSRGVKHYWIWAPEGGTTFKFQAKAGRVYQNRGDAKFALYPASEVEGKAVAHAGVPSDRESHDVTLSTGHSGLHRLEVSDSSAGTEIIWPSGSPITVASSPEQPAAFNGRWSLYFFVPKGTKSIGGFASGAGILKDGSGKKAHTFDKSPGYFNVPVPPGEDGKLWKFENSIGQRLLMTVPPYLARSAAELLLPREVAGK